MITYFRFIQLPTGPVLREELLNHLSSLNTSIGELVYNNGVFYPDKSLYYKYSTGFFNTHSVLVVRVNKKKLNSWGYYASPGLDFIQFKRVDLTELLSRRQFPTTLFLKLFFKAVYKTKLI